eukprot:6206229-Pleurochrysis_carterae.AAC.1
MRSVVANRRQIRTGAETQAPTEQEELPETKPQCTLINEIQRVNGLVTRPGSNRCAESTQATWSRSLPLGRSGLQITQKRGSGSSQQAWQGVLRDDATAPSVRRRMHCTAALLCCAPRRAALARNDEMTPKNRCKSEGDLVATAPRDHKTKCPTPKC